MEAQTAILIGAGLATCGWLYSARRARTLSRKQHTINVMLQTSFNKDFRDAQKTVGRAIENGACPDLAAGDHAELRDAVRMIANHYEFIAAGLRNGDLDERLLKDSERGQILRVYEWLQDYIWKIRDTRKRQTIYEHLEWLHERWEKTPPSKPGRVFEWLVGRPLPGKRVTVHDR